MQGDTGRPEDAGGCDGFCELWGVRKSSEQMRPNPGALLQSARKPPTRLWREDLPRR
ncbi:hypothetical protein PM082_015866 [Marasmius tenuissimus]|nr:hypothetical protein PM082_015866 [Marasmius tenuissimus]